MLFNSNTNASKLLFYMENLPPLPPPKRVYAFKRTFRKVPMDPAYRAPPRGKRKRYPAKAEGGVRKVRPSQKGISKTKLEITIAEASAMRRHFLTNSSPLAGTDLTMGFCNALRFEMHLRMGWRPEELDMIQVKHVYEHEVGFRFLSLLPSILYPLSSARWCVSS